MSTLKMVLWNMEWLNDLFVAGDEAAQFRPDNDKRNILQKVRSNKGVMIYRTVILGSSS